MSARSRTVLTYRRATPADADVLATMNREMIVAEQSRNPMSHEQLAARMTGFLRDGWTVLLFLDGGTAAGYTVFRRRTDEYHPERPSVFVRHFMLRPAYRGRGLGRDLFERLVAEVFPPGATILLEVLASNPGGRSFWEAVGFAPYAITMLREP